MADFIKPTLASNCRHCAESFQVSVAELNFLKKISPRIGETVQDIPPPTLCPACRLQRRMAHRNQIYVTRQQVGDTKVQFFSMYFGKPPFPVVSNADWWDEKNWSPEEFGREFDFTRPFFEQWAELRDSVPRPALNTISGTIENSDYCNNAGWLKDCYFVFSADRNRECLYTENITDCTDCMDCSATVNCELCYDCTGCSNCYNLQASLHCTDCSDSWYLSNCKSCSNCFGCVNLRQKKHCVYNKQLTPDEFKGFMSTLDLSSWEVRSRLETEFAKFQAGHPRPHIVATRAENCTGNQINDSRNIVNSYQIYNAEDLRNCDVVQSGGKDLYDCTISFMAPELMYECTICGLNVFNLAFCYNCWDGASELLYCDTSHGSKHCFGCVCLRRRRFCILNKQYTEAEYFSLLPKIIEHMRQTGEWGEFFPMELSPWPYNLSLANRYFPLSEREIKAQGLSWLSRDSADQQTLNPQPLPDRLPTTDEPLVTACSVSGRLFRITTQEIKRLRKFSAPLPRKAYDERMDDRTVRLGGLKLINRACARTGEKLETVYTPEEAPIIWRKDEFDREFA